MCLGAVSKVGGARAQSAEDKTNMCFGWCIVSASVCVPERCWSGLFKAYADSKIFCQRIGSNTYLTVGMPRSGLGHENTRLGCFSKQLPETNERYVTVVQKSCIQTILGVSQLTHLYDFSISLCSVTQGNHAKHKLGARFAQGWRKCFHACVDYLSEFPCMCLGFFIKVFL